MHDYLDCRNVLQGGGATRQEKEMRVELYTERLMRGQEPS